MVKILSTALPDGSVNASDDNDVVFNVESIKIVRENTGRALFYGPETRLYQLALQKGTKHKFIEGSRPDTIIIL